MSNVAKLKKRALEYEQKKQTDKALETYMQLLGMLGEHVDEVDVALYNRVGDLLLRKGDVASAVDHYERAVDLYAEGGFFNNATALCNKILRSAPGRNSVYYKLGRISAKNGFVNDARQNFLEYADRMQRLGQIDEAFRALKEFADLCPDQDDIRLMLADQLAKGNRNEEAIEQLQFLFEKLQAEGRTSEARATMERMKAIDPDLQLKQGVMRPTPKANDLIFLDVNYDEPGRGSNGVPHRATQPPARPTAARPGVTHASAGGSPVAGVLAGGTAPTEPPGSKELPVGAGTAAPAPEPPRGEPFQAGALSTSASSEAQSPTSPLVSDEGVQGLTAIRPVEDLADSMLPLLEVDFDSPLDIAPLEGLSPGAGLDGNDGAAADMDDGLVDHVDATSIPGLEETPFGGAATQADAIEPIADLEYTAHTDNGDSPGDSVLDEHGSGALVVETAPPASGPDSQDTNYPDMRDSESGGDDQAGASTNKLKLIFPGDDTEVSERVPLVPAPAQPAVEPPMVWPAAASNSERIEPLLQLPEFGLAHEIETKIDIESQLGPVSPAEPEGESGVWPVAPLTLLDGSDPEAEPEHGRGVKQDPAEDASAAPGTMELTGFEYLDIDSTLREQEIAPEPELRVVDRLRAAVASAPGNWEQRRRLGEALLEEGDRQGGLAEFEAAMLGFEREGDIRNAAGLVDEIIRVEPSQVRFHQKRVEYAVRSGDRSQLADAYFALADSLFGAGELEKSYAVYGRVLNLSPGNVRARAALDAINDLLTPEPPQKTAPEPSSNGSPPKVPPVDVPRPAPADRRDRSSSGSLADVGRDDAVPESRAPEPVAPAATDEDFVNLSEWLREGEPEKNTRMVVDVREPESQEQADFAEMLSMFKQGVAANVDDADHESHYDLGVAYKEMGLLDEAISEFQKALRGAEQRARAYEALGQCFVEKQQPQIAVTILSRALGDKNNTDDMLVGVLYLLGFASETLGRQADAQRFYERVYGVDIDFRDVRERLAAVKPGAR